MTKLVTLSGDTSGLFSLAEQLAAAPAQILNASQRAVRKVARAAMVRARRQIAAHNQLPVRVVTRRMFINRSQTDPLTYHIWFGTQPITAVGLGEPKQNKRGVRVGKHLFEGAFVAPLAGKTQVLRRTDEAAVAAGRDKHGQARRGRLPIEVVRVEIDTDHAAAVLENEADIALRKDLPRVLKAELNYELNVRGVAA